MSHFWHFRRPILNTLLLLLFLSLPIAPIRAAGTIFVVPGGAGARTGTDWANANDLAPALTSTLPGDQLWVARGIYTPTAGADRTASFTLANGVRIYGGFAGTETALSQRDWKANITVLSGEIGAPGSSDNSLHVVMAVSVDDTAVLDGFTISGGQADVEYDCLTACGGGLYSDRSRARLDHLLFRDNTASQGGGGMYNQDSSPNMTDVVFVQNRAEFSGGGMYNQRSHPTIVNATFSSNTVVLNNGGAVSNESSNPVLINVVISDNTSRAGGGMANSNSTPLMTNVVLARNRAISGGGISNMFESNAVLSNVLFLDNIAYTSTLALGGGIGGGMDNSSSSPSLSEVTFQGNTATTGGGLYSSSGSPRLTKVTFRANSAERNGGGLYAGGEPILHTVVFSNNSSLADGGGVYSNSGRISLTDTTFKDNTAISGGGMAAFRANITLANVLFESNSAHGSAGGLMTYMSTGLLANVTFLSNDALYGGGVSNAGDIVILPYAFLPPIEVGIDAGPAMMNVRFSGNTAMNGGAIHNRCNSPTIVNAVFSGNAATRGGAIFNEPHYGCASRPVILNASFSGNASPVGGAIYNIGSHPIIRNSIFWDNRGEEMDTITNTNNSTAIVSSSIVERGLPTGVIDEGGNRDADPLFASPIPSDQPNTSGDLRLLPGSAAIDAGDNNQVLTDTDLLGHARIVNSRVDMGAYETQGFAIKILRGNRQLAPPTAPFADLLVVKITSAFGEPVGGGEVVFTAPFHGASALLNGNPAKIDGYGYARVAAIANDQVGVYTVSAAATGSLSSVTFYLGNAVSINYLPSVIKGGLPRASTAAVLP
jgi:predicted outer membrane repeat protein